MKSTNLTTPRTMADCQFAHNADPIEYGQRGFDYSDKIVLLGCVIALTAFALIASFYG